MIHLCFYSLFSCICISMPCSNIFGPTLPTQQMHRVFQCLKSCASSRESLQTYAWRRRRTCAALIPHHKEVTPSLENNREIARICQEGKTFSIQNSLWLQHERRSPRKFCLFFSLSLLGPSKKMYHIHCWVSYFAICSNHVMRSFYCATCCEGSL